MRRGYSRVGVRDSRQSLSIYLRRVAKGETFEVTNRGRPVAVLTPLPAGTTAIERLAAAGRAAALVGDLRDLGPPQGGRTSQRTSKALLDLRAERL